MYKRMRQYRRIATSFLRYICLFSSSSASNKNFHLHEQIITYKQRLGILKNKYSIYKDHVPLWSYVKEYTHYHSSPSCFRRSITTQKCTVIILNNRASDSALRCIHLWSTWNGVWWCSTMSTIIMLEPKCFPPNNFIYFDNWIISIISNLLSYTLCYISLFSLPFFMSPVPPSLHLLLSVFFL